MATFICEIQVWVCSRFSRSRVKRELQGCRVHFYSILSSASPRIDIKTPDPRAQKMPTSRRLTIQ
jgi:hypothetical protein